MQGDFFYGTDGLFNRDDNHATGKPTPSAFGPQKDQKVEEIQGLHLDINNSNSKLDHYLFYFSSKL